MLLSNNFFEKLQRFIIAYFGILINAYHVIYIQLKQNTHHIQLLKI